MHREFLAINKIIGATHRVKVIPVQMVECLARWLAETTSNRDTLRGAHRDSAVAVRIEGEVVLATRVAGAS